MKRREIVSIFNNLFFHLYSASSPATETEFQDFSRTIWDNIMKFYWDSEPNIVYKIHWLTAPKSFHLCSASRPTTEI
jgi:hypothetical protein